MRILTQQPKSRAFTLVELLVVMAIIGILTVMALPALRSIQSTSMQVAARQMANTLQLARQYAINNRTPVRVLLAVDQASVGTRTDLVCRAYTVCKGLGDATGNIVAWEPLHDWRFLPTGVVFSDLNNRFYDTIDISLSTDTPTPIGVNTRSVGVAASNPTAWQWFDNYASLWITNFAGATVSWNASFVEFRPTGVVGSGSIASGPAAGIRLVQGTVLNPSTRQLLVTDTNNWVYIEYDAFGGRVRTRHKDTYRFSP